MRNVHAFARAAALVLQVSFIWALAHGAEKVSEPIAITITDKVLVKDVKRLGINLCSDNYWDCAMLKTRAVENFEGLRYRMCTWGPQIDQNGIYVWFRPSSDPKVREAMKGKVRYTILGGPDKGKSGLIKDIREQVCPADRQQRTNP